MSGPDDRSSVSGRPAGRDPSAENREGHPHRGRRPSVPRPRLRNQDIPAELRIYVNRNLKMPSVKAVGFDMDHTLAIYRSREFERLAFDASRTKLVDVKGYPDEVAAFEYDHDFVIRGLVVDKTCGNILKMDRHHYVSNVFHGLTRLSPEDRKKQYKGRKIPLSEDRFISLDTLFSLPEVSLYAQLVALMDSRGGDVAYDALYDDVRWCVDASHQDGSIKDVIQADPDYYVMHDDHLALTLDKFRRHHKKLFLLTNSEPTYTHVVMSTLLSGVLGQYASWRDYFDLVVVNARKPRFFTSTTPFEELPESEVSPGHATSPSGTSGARSHMRARRPVLSGGHAAALEERLGHKGDQILYFGDHTYGDILRSKRALGWRTAMILHELEDEIAARQRAKRQIERARNAERSLDRLLSDRDLLEIELAEHDRRRSDPAVPPAERAKLRETFAHMKRGLREMERRIERAEKRMESSWEAAESIYNANWGPIFKNGNTQSRFGAQLTRFACIYTSRASNFFRYPVRKFFKPPNENMPHELP